MILAHVVIRKVLNCVVDEYNLNNSIRTFSHIFKIIFHCVPNNEKETCKTGKCLWDLPVFKTLNFDFVPLVASR